MNHLRIISEMVEKLRSWHWTVANPSATNQTGFRMRFAVLVALYILQGIPFGLVTGSLPFVLKEGGASYRTIGVVSLSAMPYSFKILWSPLVDGFAVHWMGRRRTWVLPLGCAACALSVSLSHDIDALVAAVTVDGANSDAAARRLCWQLAVLVLSLSIMDVAVDAWAIWLLRQPCPRRPV